MPFDSPPAAPRDLLRRVFGHDDFRGRQTEVIGEVMAGRNALAVLPTGGGKSLCYQIPAMLRPGLGIVVSPLIALMADQVAGLQQLGVAAERLDSSTSPDERERIWAAIRKGELDLLYVSPEGLMQPSMLDRLSRLEIALIAIDEAHCVSQWGHDFRPNYRMLGRLAEVFPNAPRLAVTATADARTRDDIRNELHLGDAHEFVDSFARPELQLSAERKGSKSAERVLELVRQRRGQAGVVYTGSRDGADKLALQLQQAGVKALAYHAGLDGDLRARRLTEFLQGEGMVMVATIAFGMGVDKPDVRFVIHADPPSSLEAYWQEVGRAGRDGLPAEGITLYGAADLTWALRRIDERDVPDDVRRFQVGKARRLYAMLDGAVCRAAVVRRYFGEEGVQPCGQCDLCLDPPKLKNVSQAAQKALSAVQRLGGRFGKGRVIDHLLGKTKDVRPEEAALPTFGIGQDLPQNGWRDVVDHLLFEGLLVEAPNDGRPLLTLGAADAVREVYRGERQVEARADARPTGGGSSSTARKGRMIEIPARDQALFAALKAWRTEQATLQAVPPYVIFHDRTLLAIAAERPASLKALGASIGVGQTKLERYGKGIVEIVKLHLAD